mmetsp:Transcript_30813/g.59465  ORF Transcript_30813/g.59465 Transcript_30813/m.59465 type:complete len:131 (-) Transcript_30813:524-916(-)
MDPGTDQASGTTGLGSRALAARALGGKAPGGGKYGNMNPKAKLIQKDVKYFDSADWALQKEGAAPKDAAVPTEDAASEQQLEPKLIPSSMRRERKPSFLGSQDGTDEMAHAAAAAAEAAEGLAPKNESDA